MGEARGSRKQSSLLGDPLAFRCPVCVAGLGERCVSASGRVRAFHAERLALVPVKAPARKRRRVQKKKRQPKVKRPVPRKRVPREAYRRYMRSEGWAAKRLEFWKFIGGRQCQVSECSGDGKPFHVHHHTYDRFGDEDLEDLVGLCEEHHAAVHAFHREHPGMDLTAVTEHITGLRL